MHLTPFPRVPNATHWLSIRTSYNFPGSMQRGLIYAGWLPKDILVAVMVFLIKHYKPPVWQVDSPVNAIGWLQIRSSLHPQDAVVGAAVER